MRIEMMPLIDVIFLLLTFFIYAMVLMVRAELLPMDLQRFEAASAATPGPAVTISIDLAGRLYVDRQSVAIEDLLDEVKSVVSRDPRTKVYLALAAGEGEMDRAPVLTEVWDRLKDSGLDINFVGRPKE